MCQQLCSNINLELQKIILLFLHTKKTQTEYNSIADTANLHDRLIAFLKNHDTDAKQSFWHSASNT